jgi:hypothetical protein
VTMLRDLSIVVLVILIVLPLVLPFASTGSRRASFRKPALQVVIDAVPRRYRVAVAIGYLALLFLAMIGVRGW